MGWVYCSWRVSVGTLLAFTIVAVSILILRYVPPSEVLLPSFLQQSIDSVSFHHNFQNNGEEADSSGIICSNQDQDDGISQEVSKESSDYPLIAKESNKDTEESPSPNSPPRSLPRSSSTARSTSMSRTSKNSFVGMKNSLRSKSPPYYILSWLQTTCTYRGCWI
ncbi:uncharacterized protein LOC121984083 isoform X2 [Zingiber officinale]|uniref:uncharacterized protein LOC121984083 isoform X2 n=1 Tax=Zingiber officinale TaxID=94328 RepID=UPI001C4D9B31|nr:uncharacterized protein LOC121984083 isoform X2 [Zingiber officinale]